MDEFDTRLIHPLGQGAAATALAVERHLAGRVLLTLKLRPVHSPGESGDENLTFYETMPGWGLCFCRTCGTTLCGTADGKMHGVTLGSVDGDPGVQIEMHIFVGSKATWDRIGGHAPQFLEFPPKATSN
ncbi:hypothetical protein NUACC26_034550 [Scytonema sp. NUACC26]